MASRCRANNVSSELLMVFLITFIETGRKYIYCYIFVFVGSLWDFIRIEFKRGYSLENDEKEFSDRREKVYTFMKIPLEVERFMFYGFCQVRSRL